MKKIMFNDRYGLTEAVLQGRKTVTRMERKKGGKSIFFKPPYKVGEIVAVAQRYSSFIQQVDWDAVDKLAPLKGWNNKMFVKADIMPHQIRILSVRAERLQDITNKDCLREYPECDIIRERHVNKCVAMGACVISNWMERRQVFAWLIDKISGRGTWDANPFVWRIEFELIK